VKKPIHETVLHTQNVLL